MSFSLYYLNDFKIIDIDGNTSNTKYISPSNSKLWRPSVIDAKPEITLLFDRPQSVKYIQIYQHPDSIINKIQIKTDTGWLKDFELKECYKINIMVDINDRIKSLSFKILKGYSIGIYEVGKDVLAENNPMPAEPTHSQLTPEMEEELSNKE